MLTIKCHGCGELTDVGAGKICRRCGATLPASVCDEAKQAEAAYGELPAVLAALGNSKTAGPASINDAERLCWRCSELMEKIVLYQAFRQDDFNRLKNETAALYANIQDTKQKEARRGQTETEKAINQARMIQAGIKTKRTVINLIRIMVSAAAVLTIVFFIYSNVTFTDAEYKRGKDFYDKDDYENAISAFSKVIIKTEDKIKAGTKADPGGDLVTLSYRITGIELDSYLMRGRAYYRLKDYDAAIADYDRAVEIASDYPGIDRIYVSLADAYGAKEDYDKAVSYYDAYLERKSPDDPMNFTVDKTYPADMFFCVVLWKKARLIPNVTKYEKWLNEICEKNPVTEADIEAFYRKNPVITADALVNSDTLNFRPAPSTNNTPIRQLKRGDHLRIIEVEKNDWARAVNDYGEEGYVDNSLLRR